MNELPQKCVYSDAYVYIYIFNFKGTVTINYHQPAFMCWPSVISPSIRQSIVWCGAVLLHYSYLYGRETWSPALVKCFITGHCVDAVNYRLLTASVKTEPNYKQIKINEWALKYIDVGVKWEGDRENFIAMILIIISFPLITMYEKFIHNFCVILEENSPREKTWCT
jgi:hypothetical protein